MESYRNLGIILKEMYANKNLFKNKKKNHGRRLFQCSGGDANQLMFFIWLNVADVNSKYFCKLLLYGDQNLGMIANRIILEATISFIKASARLN